jgi:hypothetical protein
MIDAAPSPRGGSEVSPGSLLEDQLVQCQIRHRTAKPCVLLLQLLHPSGLVDFQAVIIPEPAIIGLLRKTDPPARIGCGSALRQHDLRLTQLADELLRVGRTPMRSSRSANGRDTYEIGNVISSSVSPISLDNRDDRSREPRRPEMSGRDKGAGRSAYGNTMLRSSGLVLHPPKRTYAFLKQCLLTSKSIID